jgi:glycosyltransferase involved in cell wall biosynthesis
MKILQIATSYPADSADPTAPFVRSIAVALAELGHELQIIVPCRGGTAQVTTEEHGVTVHWIRYAPFQWLNIIGHGRSLENDARLRLATYLALPFFIFAALNKAARIVASWKPAIMHSHWVLPGGLLGAWIARANGVPHIVSLHGSDIYVAKSRGIYRVIARWVFANTRQVIACSPYLKAQAIALGAAPERAHFLPHGVDINLFRPGDDTERLGQTPIVLAAGRLVEKKGFRLLINHAEQFLGVNPDAELWIAGEGDDRQTLEEMIRKQPPALARRIRLLGKISWTRMPELLRRARVFVMPSIRDSHGNEDGLPTVALEAMACGCAVVATDVGGTHHIVENGRTGLTVEANRGDKLAQAIERLLSDSQLAARMGAAAATAAQTQYTWAQCARAYERLYVE